MTVNEWLNAINLENRKLKKLMVTTNKHNIILIGVECAPEYYLDMNAIEEGLTYYDCQFDSDDEGNITGHSIFDFEIDHEDNTTSREVTLRVHDPNEEPIELILLRKEKENDAKT